MKLYRLVGVCCVCLLATSWSKAQDVDHIFLPEVQYSWKQSDKLKLNLGSHTFYSVSNADQSSALRYIELAAIGDYTLSSGTKIGGGYKYRLVTPGVDGYQYEHRMLEQVSFSGDLAGLKLSHRIRLEQRFRTNRYQNRLRYRFSHKKALKEGSSAYIKIADELMYTFNKDANDGQNRVYLNYGNRLSNKSTYELGLQYRLGKFFTGSDLSHVVVWSVKLNIAG